MSRIAIGRLSKYVTLQSASVVSDGAGGETVSWIDVGGAHARIDPVQAREQVDADRLDGVISHRIYTRYRTDLLGGMRLVYKDRIFRVLVTQDLDEQKRYTVSLCEEAGR